MVSARPRQIGKAHHPRRLATALRGEQRHRFASDVANFLFLDTHPPQTCRNRPGRDEQGLKRLYAYKIMLCNSSSCEKFSCILLQFIFAQILNFGGSITV